MSDQLNEQYQEALFELADKYLEEALTRGEPFTEGLCSWATHMAEQELS